ncbi:MAG: hypothetical protein K9N35_01075 [Candidatus Marinimicrobia bacterium]|nr:hypothetical protein [Candidatus Neomarinimicrobiota bacterium]
MTEDFMQSPEFQALIKEYLEYLSSTLPAVKISLSDGLYQEVYKFAHNIKGTGTSYGFPNLTQLGTDICGLINAKEMEELEKHLDEIESIIQDAIS